ncbi:MAG: ATPase, partial [Dermatophilaceae bacterium]|nr:ATPase [Dermatophilaceae bacterium]
HEVTVELLLQSATRDRSANVTPVISANAVAQMSTMANDVHVDPAVLAYISHLAQESRRHTHVRLGLSMRGCLAMVRCAKTWAISQGRTYVLPDDIKALALPIMAHRLILEPEALFTGVSVERIVDDLLAEVVAPTERVG